MPRIQRTFSLKKLFKFSSKHKGFKVFSIIFNKKFWIVPHKTTGSRVTDLLKKLDISSRAVNSLEEFKKLDFDENIDYENVNKILEKERKKSINWLIDAIEK